MKCGTPLVCSNNSSIPEIVGRAGLMVDPERVDEISLAIKNIIQEPELREKLRRLGIERAEEFKWQKTAMETITIIKSMRADEV